MKLAIKILSGPLKSKYAALKSGLKIGRSGTNLNVPDKKMSQAHGIIEENDNGELILHDLGSTNGILVNGSKKTRLLLSPGTIFRLGSTDFEIGQLSISGKEYIGSPQAAGRDIELVPQVWDEYFAEFCLDQKSISNQFKNFKAFPKLLVLQFLRGPLCQESWELAYGPRVLGRYDLEFPLYSAGLPDDLLSIDTKGGDIVLRTRYPKLVRLNDQSILSAKLTTGDILEFADTRVLLKVKDFDD